MLQTIAHLIDTQMHGTTPSFENCPYWLVDWIGFDNFQEWLLWAWAWAGDNAYRSHQRRPWHPDNIYGYRHAQDPENIPF